MIRTALTMMMAAIMLTACAGEPVRAPAKKYYVVSGKLVALKQYTYKAPGKMGPERYWGAEVKVLSETRSADGTLRHCMTTEDLHAYPHYGTLRRYKLSDTDAAALKPGLRIRGIEEVEEYTDEDYYHRGMLKHIEVPLQ